MPDRGRGELTVTEPKLPAVAATRTRAAVWVMLVRGDYVMTDSRTDSAGIEVSDPIEQWRHLYHDTHLGCLN